MPSNPQDIYARLLIPVDSTRGYPLWYPEPDDNLPEACRDEGLRIGDVGIVTERGTFDVLFNICLPAEHPLNQRGGVPATFKQVQLSDPDVCKFRRADHAGRAISTKSICERNVTASIAGGNSTVAPAQLGLKLNFTSTSAEGAILVLPEGAGTEDLLKLDTFEKEAKENGESWYRYAYVDRGRTTINNDSLYLITGRHKASSWAVAAFSDASGSTGLNVTFTAGQVVEGNIAGAYSWQVTNSIPSRVGPEERHSTNSRNQAISIRGFKIALREGVFALLRRPVKVLSGLPGTKSSTSRAYLPRSISPGNRTKGDGESQHQALGGESSHEQGLARTSCGTCKGLDVNCPSLGYGPKQEWMRDQREVEANLREGMHLTPAPILEYYEHTDDDENADVSEEEDLVDSHNTLIVLSPFPSKARKAYHPSDVINRFLLHNEPHANIAITHDTQWMGFFAEGSPIGEDELIKHIQRSFYVKYNCTGSGSVHLDERVQKVSQSPQDEDKGNNSTEEDSSEGVSAALKRRSDGPSCRQQEVMSRAERHSSEQPAPGANAGLGAFLVRARRLGYSSSTEPEIEHQLRQDNFSASVSTQVVERNGTNNMRTQVTYLVTHSGALTPFRSLIFSQPLDDVTKYVKGKGSYPEDTSGGFSDVYKCMLEKPGEPSVVVAVKALRLGTNDATALQVRGKKLRAEVHIWMRLDHPHVLKLYGIADGFAYLPALVSPWVENGTLSKYLEGPGRKISRKKRVSILIKVGEALHYIHSAPRNVVHGDLTGSNILIDGDGQPLVTDFGLASILEGYNETSYFKSHRPGSIRWVAPELLGELEESHKPSIESDVYSYGCVMLHALSGKIPYSESQEYHIPYAKVNNIRPQRPTDLPIQNIDWLTIERCLDATPGNRPELPDMIGFLQSGQA